jgi:hypothetical protein
MNLSPPYVLYVYPAHLIILSRVWSVTTDGFWIDDLTYCTL